jgi:septal ring factor EnvC (AmiA/AmiB activator)
LEQAVFQSESLKHECNKLRNDLDEIQTKYKRSATHRNKLSHDLETMSELLERRNEEISSLGKKISNRDSKIEKFERLYKGGENLAPMTGVIPEIAGEDSQSTPGYSGEIRPHRIVTISAIDPVEIPEDLALRRDSLATLEFSQDYPNNQLLRPVETFETLEDHPLSYRTYRTGSGTANYHSGPNQLESPTKQLRRNNTQDFNYSPDSVKNSVKPNSLQDQLRTLEENLSLEKSSKEKTQDELIASLQTIEKNLAELKDYESLLESERTEKIVLQNDLTTAKQWMKYYAEKATKEQEDSILVDDTMRLYMDN